MPTIDERIVQMQFDNQQFERGVSKSLSTLEKLKQSLKFDKVGESLQKIQTSFNNIDLSGLENNIEKISNRFTLLGNLGQAAMQRISNAAIDAAKNAFNTLSGIGNIKGGQSKYETRTKAVQTIMNATGKQLTEVEKILDRLQKYTDETSYDFSEMVSSIGKFTSVGVELSLAEKAMEGITNEAAKAGASKAEANRAMYNFAQALSTGSVKLIDWKSIENANMATREFKEELIKTAIELGTVGKKTDTVGKIMKQTKKATKQAAAQFSETEVSYKTFNSTLSEGWLTSDVLLKTLDRYADTTTELGKSAYQAAKEYLTFGDVLDTIKDTVTSGWMRTFQALFGNLEEARTLWTRVGDSIVDLYSVFSEYRISLVESWHEMGGYTAAIDAASNVWHTFRNIVLGVKEAIEKIFPPMTAERLVGITESLKKASEQMLKTFGLYEEVTDEAEETTEKIADGKKATDKIVKSTKKLSNQTNKVSINVSGIYSDLKKGSKGNEVKKLQKQLNKLGLVSSKLAVDGIFGDKTQQAIKALQKELGVAQTGIWDAATRAAASTNTELSAFKSNASETNIDISKTLGLGSRGSEVKKLQNMLNDFRKTGDKLVADGIFGPKTQEALKEFQKEIGVKQTGVFDKATKEAINGTTNVSKAAVESAEKTEEATNETTPAMKRVQNIVTGWASIVEVVVKSIDAAFTIVKNIAAMFKPLVKVGTRFASMIASMSQNFAKALGDGDAYSKFANAVITFLKPVGDFILNVAKSIELFIATYAKFLKTTGKTNNFSTFINFVLHYLKTFESFNKIIGIVQKATNVVKFFGKNIKAVFDLASGKLTAFGKKWGWIRSLDHVLFMIEYYLGRIPIIGKLIKPFEGNLLIDIKNRLVSFVLEVVKAFKRGDVKSIQDFFAVLYNSFKKSISGTKLGAFVITVEKIIRTMVSILSKARSIIVNIIKIISDRVKRYSDIIVGDLRNSVGKVIVTLIKVRNAISKITKAISKRAKAFSDEWGWIFSGIDQFLFSVEYFLSKIPIVGALFKDADGAFNGNILTGIKARIITFITGIVTAFKNGDIRSIQDFFTVLHDSFKNAIKGTTLEYIVQGLEEVTGKVIKILSGVKDFIVSVSESIIAKAKGFISDWGWMLSGIDQFLFTIEYFLSKVPIIGALFKDTEGAFNGDILTNLKNNIFTVIFGLGKAISKGNVDEVLETIEWYLAKVPIINKFVGEIGADANSAVKFDGKKLIGIKNAIVGFFKAFDESGIVTNLKIFVGETIKLLDRFVNVVMAFVPKATKYLSQLFTPIKSFLDNTFSDDDGLFGKIYDILSKGINPSSIFESFSAIISELTNFIKSIKDKTDELFETLTSIGDENPFEVLFEFGKKAVQDIVKYNIEMPFNFLTRKIGNAYDERIVRPIQQMQRKFDDSLNDSIGDPIYKFASDIGRGIEHTLQPLNPETSTSGFFTMISSFGDAVSESMKTIVPAISGFKEIVSDIFSKMFGSDQLSIFKMVTTIITKINVAITNFFKAFNTLNAINLNNGESTIFGLITRLFKSIGEIFYTFSKMVYNAVFNFVDAGKYLDTYLIPLRKARSFIEDLVVGIELFLDSFKKFRESTDMSSKTTFQSFYNFLSKSFNYKDLPIVKFIVSLIDVLKEAYNIISESLSKIVSLIIGKSINVFGNNNIIDSILLSFTNFNNGITSILKSLEETGIVQTIGNIINTAGRLIATFAEMLTGGIFRISSIGSNKSAISNVTDIFDTIDAFVNSALEGINKFLDGYERFIKKTKKSNSIGSFISYFIDNLDGLLGVGEFVDEGLKKGLNMAGGGIIDAAVSLAESLYSAVCKFLGIESPSKKFMFIGSMCIAGLIAGVATGLSKGIGGKKISETLKQFGENVKHIIGKVSPIFTGLGNAVNDLMSKISSAFSERNVSSIPEFFAALWDGIKKELPLIGRIVDAVGPIAMGFFNAVLDLIEKVSSAFKNTKISNFSDFFAALGQGIKNVIPFDGGNGKFTKFFAPIIKFYQKMTGEDSPLLGAIATVTNLINELKELGDLTPIIERLKGIFTSVLDQIDNLINPENYSRGVIKKDTYEKRKKDLMDRVKDIGKIIGTVLWPAIAAMAAKAVASFMGGLKDFADIAKNKAGIKSDTIGDTVLKIAGSIAILAGLVAILASLPAENVNRALSVIQTIIIDMVLLATILAALDTVKSQLKVEGNMGRQLLEAAASIGALGLGIIIMVTALKYAFSKGNIGAAIGSIFMIVALLAAFGFLEYQLAKVAASGVTGKAEVSIKGIFDMCKGLLVAVIAFGALVFILSKTNFTTAIGALAIFTIFLADLSFIMAFMANQASQNATGEITANIKGMLPMAGALLLIVLAYGEVAKTIDKYGGWVATGAFLIVETFIASLSAIAYLFQKFSDEPKDMAIKAAALAISAVSMGLSVALIGQALTAMLKGAEGLEVGSAIALMAGMTLIIAAISATILLFQKITENQNGTEVILRSTGLAIAMIGMGISIGVMAWALGNAAKNLKHIDWTTLAAFEVGIIGLIWSLAGIAMLFKTTGALDLLVVGAALAGAIAILGFGIGLFATFASYGVEEAGQALWLVGSDLGQFSDMISKVDWDQVGNAVNFLVNDLTSIWGSVSAINFDTFLDKMVKLDEVGAQLNLYGGHIGTITQEVLDSSTRVIEMLSNAKSAADIAETISIPDIISGGALTGMGSSLYNYGNAISQIGVTSEQAQLAKQLATDAADISSSIASIENATTAESTLTLLGQALKMYYGSLNEITLDENGKAQVPTVDSQMISDAFTALANAIPKDTIDKISTYVSGGDNDMVQVALGIGALGDALGNYGTKIGALEKDKVEAANTVLGTLANVSQQLTTPTDAFGFIVGDSTSNNPFGKFADDIASLGTALGTYGSQIGNLDYNKVVTANTVISNFLQLEDTLNKNNKKPDFSKLFGFLKGEQQNMTQFSGDIVILGESLGKYADSISDVDPGKIETANGIIDKILNTAKDLPESGGLLSKLFGGQQSLGSFAVNIGNLGDGVAQFASKVSGQSFTNVTSSIRVIDKVVGILGNIEKSGGIASWFTGDKNIGNIANGLGDLGSELADFKTNSQDVKLKDVEEALGIVETVLGWSKLIDGNQVYDQTTMQTMDTFTYIVAKVQETLSGISDLKKIKGADGKSIIDTLVSIGKDVSISIGNGIKSDEEIVYATDAMGVVMDEINSKIRSYYDIFMESGKYVVEGLIAGLKDPENLKQLSSAGLQLAIVPTEANREGFDVQSPSREFEWTGQMCALGLKNGFDKYGYLVTDSTLDLANASLAEIMAAFDKSKLKDVTFGAMEALKPLISKNKGDKYTKEDRKLIKQVIVMSGYLKETEFNNLDKIKEAVKTFKKEVLGYEGNVTAGWGYNETWKLYNTINRNRIKNGSYDEIQYEKEMMQELGETYVDTNNKIVKSNEKVAKSNKKLNKIGKDMQKEFGVGNVNLRTRKKISKETMQNAGWKDFDGTYATLYSSTFSAGDKNKGYDYAYKKNVVVDITPITKDGEVLSPEGLENYMQQLVGSGMDLLEADNTSNGGLGLILRVDDVEEDLNDAYKKSEKWTNKLHNVQAKYYKETSKEEEKAAKQQKIKNKQYRETVELQKVLMKYGYLKYGDFTYGKYDEKMYNAVSKFSKDIFGITDKSLSVSELNDMINKLKETNTLTKTIKENISEEANQQRIENKELEHKQNLNDYGNKPTVSAKGIYDNLTEGGGDLYKTALSKGSKGDTVKQLQKRLVKLGFLTADGVTGIFDSATEDAVKKLQKDMHFRESDINGKWDSFTAYNAVVMGRFRVNSNSKSSSKSSSSSKSKSESKSWLDEWMSGFDFTGDADPTTMLDKVMTNFNPTEIVGGILGDSKDGSGILGGLFGGIMDPENGIGSMLTGAFDLDTDNVGKIFEFGGDIGGNLLEGIKSAIPGFDIVETLKGVFFDEDGTFKIPGSDILDGLKGMFSGAGGAILEAIGGSFKDEEGNFKFPTELSGIGGTILGGITGYIKDNGGTIWSSIVDSLKDENGNIQIPGIGGVVGSLLPALVGGESSDVTLKPVIDSSDFDQKLGGTLTTLITGESSPMVAIGTSLTSANSISKGMREDVQGFKSAYDETNKKILEKFDTMTNKIQSLDNDILNMKIYLDSDAIVAGTVSKFDTALGKRGFNARKK